MENKKEGKKLNLQKIKIAKLNRVGLRHIQGGTGENPIDFSATLCETDTCTSLQPEECDPKSDHHCRSVGRACVGG